MAPPGDVWSWALAHWQHARVPRLRGIAVEAA
jgi:hypothetical protein